MGFCFSLKFRWGLSVKLGVTFMKIRWGLTEKLGDDFVKWGFVSPNKPWILLHIKLYCIHRLVPCMFLFQDYFPNLWLDITCQPKSAIDFFQTTQHSGFWIFSCITSRLKASFSSFNYQFSNTTLSHIGSKQICQS